MNWVARSLFFRQDLFHIGRVKITFFIWYAKNAVSQLSNLISGGLNGASSRAILIVGLVVGGKLLDADSGKRGYTRPNSCERSVNMCLCLRDSGTGEQILGGRAFI